MVIETERHIKELGRWFSTTGEQLYLVGGYVRSKLLSLPVYDVDICAPVSAERLRALQNENFAITEREYGLGSVVISQQFEGKLYEYEYTAFRSDSYGRGGEHRPQSVYFTRDIALDAARRDFSINAIYSDTKGNVLDPLNRGLSDLVARKISMCTKETLDQDALRIMRLVRFAAQLGFSPDANTFSAAMANAPKLCNISAERIRNELVKTIMADAAYGNKDGVLCGLHLMKELNIFECVLPELLLGDGFEQTAKYHAYDVLEHSLRSCAAAKADVVVRLAALLHDVEKPGTYKKDGNMYRHAEQSAYTAGDVLLRLKFENCVVKDVVQLIAAHMFDLENDAKQEAVLRMIIKLGKNQFFRLCDLREADFIGSGKGADPASARKWRSSLNSLIEQDAPLELSRLAVTGNDIIKELNMPQGKGVGRLLCKLQLLALKKPSQNSYKNLIRYAKMMYNEKLNS